MTVFWLLHRSTVGVYRIKHLHGCNSATLTMEVTTFSETFLKLTTVHRVKLQQLFSDLHPPWEPKNLITWLKFLTDILLLIQNSKTAVFEYMHHGRIENFREKLIYKYKVFVYDSQGCNLLRIGQNRLNLRKRHETTFLFNTKSKPSLWDSTRLKHCSPTDKSAGARICLVTSF